MSKRAFTLVELMIVIAIIGILAAALFPSMSNYIARANNRALIEEMRKIGMAANMDFNDFGNYAPDINPSDCSYIYQTTNIPRFVSNGGYPLTKWKTTPQKINRDWCFDWQNWDLIPGREGWASIEVYLMSSTGVVNIPKVYCLYQGRFDSNASHCQNVGTD